MSVMTRLLFILFLAMITGCAFVGGEADVQPIKTNKGLVVWNGEELNAGSSWAQANHEDGVASVSITQEQAFSGEEAIGFSGEGVGWLGFGWNWQAYKPNSGVDVTGYNFLVFMLKLTGSTLPDAGTISAQLASGGPGNQRSVTVHVEDYTNGDLHDGDWHEVKMPLPLFLAPFENAQPINLRLLSELSVGAWTDGPEEIDFEMYIDDIAFQ